MATLSLRKRADSSIAQKLEECPEIRPFPAVVPKLLSSLQDPNADASDIARIIECDPALAVRLLRMANSPLYGIRTEIRSIEHACSLLGMRALKTLSLSVAGAGMFKEGQTASLERAALWNHSIGCATVAKLLTQFIPSVAADDAFLAGVFHDVGKLLFLDVCPQEYASLIERCSGSELVSEERFRFATTHEQLGLRSAYSWNLSENIRVAIGCHHDPKSAQAHGDLATVVQIADGLARNIGVGSASSFDVKVPQTTLEEYGLDDDAVAYIRQEAPTLYEEATRACA